LQFSELKAYHSMRRAVVKKSLKETFSKFANFFIEKSFYRFWKIKCHLWSNSFRKIIPYLIYWKIWNFQSATTTTTTKIAVLIQMLVNNSINFSHQHKSIWKLRLSLFLRNGKRNVILWCINSESQISWTYYLRYFL
jgi:hypothetical protein